MFSELIDIVSAGIYNSDVVIRNKSVTETKKRPVSMFEIEIPVEDGGISYINSYITKIESDLIICAKPGQIRHTKLPFKCYYIHMIPKSNELYNILMNIPDYIKTDKKEEYVNLFKNICKYSDSKLEDSELMLGSLILRLTYMLLKESRKTRLKSNTKYNNYPVIEKVIKYIKENLTEDLSLKTVSAYAGFSHIHFHNFFKKATGLTLREYVEEQRLKRAVNMLVSTSATLTEIAHECGFSSQSYFSYAFKKRMGCTPGEYVHKNIVG